MEYFFINNELMKCGFVYVWFDRKHKRYYVGSHWGPENDGYICSSDNMKHNYKNRPQDFKRKIVERIYTNRQDLLKAEQHWFDMIKPHEFGRKYYNVNSKVGQYAWWMNEETKKQVVAKLRNNEKRKETWRKKFESGYVIHNKNKPHSEKHKAKLRGRTPWNKDCGPEAYSNEVRQRMSSAHKTEEYNEKMPSHKLSEYGRKGGLITGAMIQKGEVSSGFNTYTKKQLRALQKKGVKSRLKKKAA